MLVHVKTPLIDINIKGDVPNQLLKTLNKLYPQDVDISLKDEELTNIRDTDFWKDISDKMSPGIALKVMRERDGYTQKQLAEKVGVYPQHLSNMENGSRAISKELAKKFSKIFEVNVGRFI